MSFNWHLPEKDTHKLCVSITWLSAWGNLEMFWHTWHYIMQVLNRKWEKKNCLNTQTKFSKTVMPYSSFPFHSFVPRLCCLNSQWYEWACGWSHYLIVLFLCKKEQYICQLQISWWNIWNFHESWGGRINRCVYLGKNVIKHGQHNLKHKCDDSGRIFNGNIQWGQLLGGWLSFPLCWAWVDRVGRRWFSFIIMFLWL